MHARFLQFHEYVCLPFHLFFHRLQVLECLSSQGLTLSVSSAIEGTVGSIGSMGSYSGTTSTSVIKARLDQSFQRALYYALIYGVFPCYILLYFLPKL
jgi:hypothetical protein